MVPSPFNRVQKEMVMPDKIEPTAEGWASALRILIEKQEEGTAPKSGDALKIFLDSFDGYRITSKNMLHSDGLALYNQEMDRAKRLEYRDETRELQEAFFQDAASLEERDRRSEHFDPLIEKYGYGLTKAQTVEELKEIREHLASFDSKKAA